jgi:hypothetical protein
MTLIRIVGHILTSGQAAAAAAAASDTQLYSAELVRNNLTEAGRKPQWIA